MRVLCTGNCQANGIAHFLRMALPSWEIHHLPHLATFFGEFTEEQIAAEHAWADLVFFHHKSDNPQNYPTKNPKIPLSVWYQSAPFMMWVPEDLWARAKSEGVDLETAVTSYDFDYKKRWQHCADRFVEKEINEEVPPSLRMSDMLFMGRTHQLQLTANHPTSLVFREWTLRILDYLGEPKNGLPSEAECIQNPNIAGLPCEESATTGGRKHLDLSWGGRPEDDESGRLIARRKLGLL